jgi:hypothetical protein
MPLVNRRHASACGIVTRDLYSASEFLTVVVEISGDCGGSWILAKDPLAWTLVRNSESVCKSRVTIPQALAWRLFTKGIDPDLIRPQIKVEGDPILGEKVLHLTAIVG